MTFAPADARAEADRCPGVLRPHRAADGALLRLRLPGGRLSAESLRILGMASRSFGNGEIQVTSRGNLQLRGVATAESGAVSAGLVDEVVRAGLLPRPSHERVRNIVCSPLTGISGGLADLRPLIPQLDDKLCQTAVLADLPGPFLFSLDDGRGDVAALSADLGVQAVDAVTVRVRVGELTGPVIPLWAAPEVLAGLACQFLAVAGEHPDRIWHVRELPRGGHELLPGSVGSLSEFLTPTRPGIPVGRLPQNDGREMISTLVPLGLLTWDQIGALVESASWGSDQLVVTPWRGVVVPDLPAAVSQNAAEMLAAAGLEVDGSSAWRGVTACTGAPRCAHGQGATRSLAGAVAAGPGPGELGVNEASAEVGGAAPASLLPVHVIGCSRNCGSPSGEHVELRSDGLDAHISCGARTVEVPLASAAMTVRRLRQIGASA